MVKDSFFDRSRESMITDQLKTRGIADEKVLEAFRRVPRHLFVRKKQIIFAYEDYPLPIDQGQTISQPYIVALMTESLELRGDEKVLEIGTGSGYQTAILAELAGHVFSVERFPGLSKNAASVLKNLGYRNISYRVGDGTKGWPEKAPFQRILVAAAAGSIPGPLIKQLDFNGRLVMPVGGPDSQEMIVLTKNSRGEIKKEKMGGCRFLPLVEEDS